MENREITHIPELKTFTLRVDDDFAKIVYTIENNVLYLIHSEVPRNLRGKGIGKELVEKTFEYLHTHQIKAVAVCSFIKTIVNRSEKLKKIA